MLERLDTVIAFSIVMLLLSLLVTTLVQMLGVALRLRGSNLLWGMKRLLRQVNPDLPDHLAHRIGDRILRHPAVSHIGRARAVAIRKDELVRLLQDLAAGRVPKDQPWIWRALLSKLDDFFTRHPRIEQLALWLFPNPGRPLDPAAQTSLENLLKAMPPGATPQQAAQVQVVANSLMALLPAQAAAFERAAGQALAGASRLSSEVDAWFDSVMDRTSERFKLYNRYMTAAAAVLLALLLQVDSFDVFRQLSNKDVRTAVLDLYGPALGINEEIQGLKARQSRLASGTLVKLRQDSRFTGWITADPAEAMEARSAGEEWLEQPGRLAAGLNEEQKAQLTAAYRVLYDSEARALFGDVETATQKPLGLLEKAGLKVTPEGRVIRSWNDLKIPAPRVPGVLASALFLSLGAPFWYNALRKLADLRPIVARKVEGEAPKAQR